LYIQFTIPRNHNFKANVIIVFDGYRINSDAAQICPNNTRSVKTHNIQTKALNSRPLPIFKVLITALTNKASQQKKKRKKRK